MDHGPSRDEAPSSGEMLWCDCLAADPGAVKGDIINQL